MCPEFSSLAVCISYCGLGSVERLPRVLFQLDTVLLRRPAMYATASFAPGRTRCTTQANQVGAALAAGGPAWRSILARYAGNYLSTGYANVPRRISSAM